MGVYLNSTIAYTLYKNESQKTYFVDKTRMLAELIPLVEQGSNYLCVTRPRRFGKTIAANMIASFFSKGRDSSDIFDAGTVRIPNKELMDQFDNTLRRVSPLS